MQNISTENAPKAVGKYPHSKIVNQFLFLSGVGPRKPNAKTIPGVELDIQGNIVNYDIEVQTKSTFENVKKILEASNSNWENLVDVTVFLTNMKKDFQIFNKIWSEYFDSNGPTRTTIEINALPTPIAIELKCIATIS